MKNIYIYGDSFTGKTVFANQFPNVFFLSTDGNAKYLTDNFVEVTNREELAKALQAFYSRKYDTLVFDRVDEIYDIIANGIFEKFNVDFAFEMKGFGEGYTRPRKSFKDMFSMLEKKLPKDFTVIWLSTEKFTESVSHLNGATIKTFIPTLDKGTSQFLQGKSFITMRSKKEKTIKGIQYVLSCGGDENELSGSRVPIKNKKIINSYEAFKENIGGQL